MNRFTWSLLACLLTAFPVEAQQTDGWLLPNLAHRLTVEISNPTSDAVKGLASVNVAEARMVAPDFPGRLAFALLVNDKEGAQRPGGFLPVQVDDLDGDGVPDQVLFAAELAPRERRRVDLYYSTTLSDTVAYPKRVQAKHSYGYNRQVAALESEWIGYRTYGGFFLDFMGRLAGAPGLNNDLAGYVSVRGDLGTGRDVFHIGATLGLGGVFLRRNGKVFQPPMNVPDYAHKPSPAVVPHYRVVSQGPLRAIVEATLDDWDVDGDVVRLKAVYSIDAGMHHVQCRFEAAPVKIAAGHGYEIGAGVRELPGGAVTPESGRLVVTGRQNVRDGEIGLGLFYDAAQFGPLGTVATADGPNHSLVYRQKLAAGQSVRFEYAAAGAWGGSGISDLLKHLKAVGQAASARIATGGLRYQPTPKPEKVDAEAQ